MRAVHALAWIAQLSGLEWGLKDGAVYIAKPGSLPAGSMRWKIEIRKTERAWKLEAAKRLAIEVTLQFENAPVEWMASELHKIAGQNIIVDPVVADGLKKYTCSLKVEEMPVSEALTLITRQAGLDWELRHGAVYIAPKEKITDSKALPDPPGSEDIF